MRREVTLDTGRASYLATGSDDGATTLVGIHGASNCAEAFMPLFAQRALSSMRCIAIDLPGRYGSTSEARTAVADARFVLDVVEAIGRSKRTVVIGHSYGGAVAIECALAGTVDALVLVATGARLRVRPDILTTYEAAARDGSGPPRGLPWTPDLAPEVGNALDRAFARVPVASSYADWCAANDFDRMSALETIRAPTFVLSGDQDPFTPMKYGEFLAKHIPGASIERIAGGSHMAVVERAPDVAESIARFVAHL